MNVILLENHVFADLIKLRLDHSGLVWPNLIGIFTERERFGHRDTQGRMPCDKRDWNDAAAVKEDKNSTSF